MSAGDTARTPLPPPPKPIRSTPLLDGAWQDLAADLMGPLPSEHSLLVVTDHYSRFYEVDVMQSTTTQKIIDCLADAFRRHGLPNAIKSITRNLRQNGGRVDRDRPSALLKWPPIVVNKMYVENRQVSYSRAASVSNRVLARKLERKR